MNYLIVDKVTMISLLDAAIKVALKGITYSLAFPQLLDITLVLLQHMHTSVTHCRLSLQSFDYHRCIPGKAVACTELSLQVTAKGVHLARLYDDGRVGGS